MEHFSIAQGNNIFFLYILKSVPYLYEPERLTKNAEPNRKPVKSRLAERNIFGKILRKFWGKNSDKLTILVQDVLTIETMDHFINEFLSGSI